MHTNSPFNTWFAQTWQDLRFAFRQLTKSPGFTGVAIAVLAVGIAANTSIFSALDTALFRPLPFSNPEQMVVISETREGGELNGVSGGAFHDWRDNSTQIEAIALVDQTNGNLRTGNVLERIDGMKVTQGFLEVLGLTPLRGRGLQPADEVVGGNNRVVMLTAEIWRSRFGADESLVGRTIMLNDEPHEVIGIVPANAWLFDGPQYFVPAVIDPQNTQLSGRSLHWADVIARMKPGVTPVQLDAELKTLKESLNHLYPGHKQTWSVRVQPLQSMLAENPRPILITLVGAVALVLLICCANVANLLLARSSRRRREISLRAALGATGRRLVRQTMTESLLLATLGGAAGIVLSWWGIKAVGVLSADLLPQVMAPELNLRVLALSLALTVSTGVLFGLLPAWHTRRPDLNEALKSGSQSVSAFRRNRSQSVLIVAELALTLLLLTSSGLLLRSLAKTTLVDPGIDVEQVLTFDLSPSESRYSSPESRISYLNQVLDELSSVPGVQFVGTSVESPFMGGAGREVVARPDLPPPEVPSIGRMNLCAGDYYEAMGMRLLMGRTQTETEFRPDPPQVVVINETLANQFFPGENPIGRQLYVSGLNILEIIGVVADVRSQGLDQSPPPQVYASHAFGPFRASIVVRTHGMDPLALTTGVRAALDRVDPGIPMANTRSLEQAMNATLGQRRLVLGLVGGFAATALVLACIGLYGVMSYSVAGRRRELAIRLALGASRRAVSGIVLADAGRLTLIGLGFGLFATLASSRLIANQLYAVPPHDPLVLAAAPLILGVVALFACWLPARRAAKADPVEALRAE